MADNIIDTLKAELEKLRSEADISYSAMEASINRIKEVIAKGTCYLGRPGNNRGRVRSS